LASWGWPRGVREMALALAVALAATLAIGAAGNIALLRGAETATLDMRFRLRGALKPSQDIAVILADDVSLAKLGRWPFPRRLFIAAIDRLRAAGVRVIAFDLLFAEREESVPERVRAMADKAAAMTRTQDAELAGALRALATADPDADFAIAMSHAGNVLLPVAFGFGVPAAEPPASLAPSAFARFDKSTAAFDFPLQPTTALLPQRILAQAAAGLGNVNVAYSRDGTARYDYAVLPFDVDYYPSIAVRAAAAYRSVAWQDVALRLGTDIRLGDEIIPTDAAMRMLINYRGPRGTIPTYSFADLLAGRVNNDALRNRIVLIGASFVGDPDSFVGPFDATPVPGTERIANAIETILQHDFIREYPPGPTALILAAGLLASALIGFSAARISMAAALGCAVVLAASLFAAAQTAFGSGLWLPLVQPELALMAATASVLLYRYWFVERQRRRVRAAFGRYMAPDMVEILAAHPDRLRLGGETRQMTLLFCDIRGFTSISERFKADPQALTQLINRFLTPMTDTILAHGGTIDKYIGDCIMAFWNAPLDDMGHAGHACASALAMQTALARLNETLWAEAGSEEVPVQLAIGIGINSGDCVVGNMGSEQRFDYSVLGDAVNLASRLEGQSKYYHVCTVIGEATRALAPGFAALELDLIAVKGKQDAVRIFTLLGDVEMADSPAYLLHAAAHNRMLHCYRACDWADAAAALQECRGFGTALSGFYDLYDGRIAAFTRDPPPVDWSGIYVAEQK
jgi:adenylate cyclase